MVWKEDENTTDNVRRFKGYTLALSAPISSTAERYICLLGAEIHLELENTVAVAGKEALVSLTLHF